MQRKAEQKKVSACCPESGISDTLKESSAAGEAGPAAGFCKMRESAHKKRTAAYSEISDILKRAYYHCQICQPLKIRCLSFIFRVPKKGPGLQIGAVGGQIGRAGC